MNYTEKFHLPQWEENDRVMRTDFNQAMAGIESGINKTDSASVQRDNALSSRIDSAQAAADKAQATADVLPYAVGTYTGNYRTNKITLGFRPSAVLINRVFSSENDLWHVCAVFAHDVDGVITFNDDGFTLLSVVQYPNVNWIEAKYCYVAFR